MRAKLVEIPSFRELYDMAPEELKKYIDRCGDTPQSKTWHPEGDVCKHIKIVYNRARKSGDINLALAAFFHDMGKADVTRPHPTKPGAFPAHGHENVSARLVEKYSKWIEEFGADPEIVHYIVKSHMRIQQIHKMRPVKRERFQSEPHYKYVNQFTKYDDMSNLTKDELITK